MLKLNKIYCENCLDTMGTMENDSVDMACTSPPYGQIREYKGFDFNFEKIADELTRVLKPGGVIAWIVNDQYINGSRTLDSFRQAIYFKDICNLKVHDVMIYQKSNFSFPANNRYHQIYEFIHILSKGKPKTFNPLIDRKNAYPGQKPHGRMRRKDGGFEAVSSSVKVRAEGCAEYGKRYNIWRVNTGGGHSTKDKFAHGHPAIFPEQLAGDLIRSFSNENDLIYDPMAGSGTTLKMAKILNRNFIGSEISEEYCKISRARIQEILL